jgi:uncharacterized protein
MLDLSHIPLVDNHCHGLLIDTSGLDVAGYRHRFSECAGEPFPPEHTSTAPHYLWAIRQIAVMLECEPTEQAVIDARAACTRDRLDELFLGSAGIDWLLVDDGYPDPAQVSTREQLAQRSGLRIGWLERVESVAAALAHQTTTFSEWDDALTAHLGSARRRGVCGLKSVAAYRSGLAVSEPDAAAVREAFERLRAMDAPRVQEKPLEDHVVLRIMQAARAQELPVQFHTGYGDADADLRLADPLHLAPLMRMFPTVPVVMLHGAYPWTRSLAVLAGTYRNAYVDVSYAIPFLTAHELLAITHEALGCAPAARFMYSSDAVGLPEQHWLGAVRGRRAIGTALGEMVDAGDLAAAEALDLAELILRGNAERIYGL